MGFASFPASGGYPNSSYGIWRGTDISGGGSGSGMGPAQQGTGRLPQGWGSIGSLGSMGGAWEPSIWYLFALVVAEMVIFHVISRMLK